MSVGSPRSASPRAVTYLVLAVIITALYVPTLSNPGFFSHDEWGIHDRVTSHGLRYTIALLGRVHAGANFGVPVRPVGFIQQALFSRWMQTAPLVPHAVSVALHVVIASVFAVFLQRAGTERSRAIAAAILFGASPLAVFATAWIAACFDQWYALFGLAAACVSLSILARGLTAPRAAALLCASAGAILSKETAVILPAAVIVLVVALTLLRRKAAAWRRVMLIGALTTLPVLGYLALRLPAIAATLQGHGGAYRPTMIVVPRNAFFYFAFPFLISTTELAPAASLPIWELLGAAGLHLLVVAAITIRKLACGGLYLIAYFIFLLPVMSLPAPQSHYLYASAFALSSATAYLLLDADGRFRVRATSLLAAAATILLTLHALNLEQQLAADGRCQRTFLSSLDAQLAGPNSPGVVIIRPAATARWWVGRRAVHDREAYATVHVIGQDAAGPSNFIMDPTCRVVAAVN